MTDVDQTRMRLRRTRRWMVFWTRRYEGAKLLLAFANRRDPSTRAAALRHCHHTRQALASEMLKSEQLLAELDSYEGRAQ